MLGPPLWYFPLREESALQANGIPGNDPPEFPAQADRPHAARRIDELNHEFGSEIRPSNWPTKTIATWLSDGLTLLCQGRRFRLG